MIAYIMGGLGNQMFQYAAGLAVAKRLGESLELNTTFYDSNKSREYQLFHFPISARVTDEFAPKVEEVGFPYQEINQSGMMFGYWQTEKYFVDIADQIREEFALPRAELGRVAVHVRRGDYLQLPQVFHTQGVDYYERARREFPGCEFIAFSDDPEWAKENLPWADVIEGNPPIVDLALMASCDGIIMANSSFSWWAAWLGNKKVVAPSKWFTCSHDTRDLIPDRWIKI
jgi:hypothetical protein